MDLVRITAKPFNEKVFPLAEQRKLPGVFEVSRNTPDGLRPAF
jgi:hypothetical protein